MGRLSQYQWGISSLIGLFLMSLFFTSSNDLPDQKYSKQLNEVIKRASDAEKRGFSEVIEIAEDIILSADDSIEKVIGHYYKDKAIFYHQPIQKNVDRLNSYRSFFESKGLYNLLYEIDRLSLINAYNAQDLEAANEQIDHLSQYILSDDFFPERTALVHATNQNPNLLYTAEHNQMLEKALAYNLDVNSMTYSALITARSNYYNHIGEIYRANDLLEDYLIALENFQNNLYSPFALQLLASRRQSVDQSIKDISLAIDHMERSGYRIMLSSLWRDLGKYQRQKQRYNESYESFHKAYAIDSLLIDSIALALDEMGSAESLYLANPEQLDYAVRHHLARAERYAGRKVQPMLQIYEAEMRIYTMANRAEQVQAVSKKIHDLNDENHEILEDEVRDFVNKKMLEYETKDMKIDDLKEDNEIQRRKLRLQKYVLVLSVMLIIGIAVITHLLIKTSKSSQRNAKNSRLLSQANRDLEEKNKQIESQMEVLSEKENQLRAELQSKLSLLQTQSKSMVKLEEEIKNVAILDSNQKNKVAHLIKDLNANVAMVDELKIQMTELNKAFVERLTQKHPNLTNNNIMLCIYLSNNLTTKEIALLNQSTANTVKVARNRLRKKLGLQGKNIRLSAYLNGI